MNNSRSGTAPDGSCTASTLVGGGEGLATLTSPALVVLDVLILALLLRLVGLDLAQGIRLAAQR